MITLQDHHKMEEHPEKTIKLLQNTKIILQNEKKKDGPNYKNDDTLVKNPNKRIKRKEKK